MVIFGFGRVGRMVADMLDAHDKRLSRGRQRHRCASRPRARRAMTCCSATSPRPSWSSGSPRPAERAGPDDGRSGAGRRGSPGSCAARFPTCRSSPAPATPAHAAELYQAGVTDAVPETLEASLQLSEAVLVDIGVAMGPVIASIHEKRGELRARDHGRGRAGRGAAAWAARRLQGCGSGRPMTGSNRSTPGDVGPCARHCRPGWRLPS